MKKLLFAILLTLPCASISQTTGQNSLQVTEITYSDSTETSYNWSLNSEIENYKPLTIPPSQVFSIYVGLKRGEEFRKRLSECTEIANSLNGIIQQQNDSLQVNVGRITTLNSEIQSKQEQLLENSVEIEQLKKCKTQWWKWPTIYGVLGLVGGILITK